MIKFLEVRKHLFNYRNIGVFNGYKPTESEHIHIRFKERHPKIEYVLFQRYLNKALDEIAKRIQPEVIEVSSDPKYMQLFRMGKDVYKKINYMIISKNTNVKFPIEVEIFNSGRVNAIVTTILDKIKHPINTHDEVEIYLRESEEEI